MYYVYRRNGEVRRIAKISNGSAYAYIKSEWVSMQGLIKIQHDITDFEEITKEEVEKLIAEYRPNALDVQRFG